MKPLIFAFVTMTLALTMSPNVTSAATSSPQCELAAQIIRQEGHPVVNKTWAFEDAGDNERKNLARFEILDRRSWPKRQPPPSALIAEFLHTPMVSLVTACPELPGLIKSLGGSVIDPGDSSTHVGADLKFSGPDVVSASLPVLGRDGADALVFVSDGCGPTCGAGFLLWLRRNADGRWRTVDRMGAWIS